MRMEDSVYFTDKDVVWAGHQISSRSIMNYDIMDLIYRLEEEDIKINPADSEQEIKYRVLGDERESTVPLQATFGNLVEVVGYILRNRTLMIEIKDYHEIGGIYRKIGGPVRREDGVQCFFEFNGTDEESHQFGTAKKVLKEFYK